MTGWKQASGARASSGMFQEVLSFQFSSFHTLALSWFGRGFTVKLLVGHVIIKLVGAYDSMKTEPSEIRNRMAV